MVKERITEINNILAKEVSPTFCFAKFHYPTISLQTGEVHSCHHTPVQKIPLEEIKESMRALHNTKNAKIQRVKMLKGEKPKGCDYCWNIEALGHEYKSDRHQRNEFMYDSKGVEEIKKGGGEMDINPRYVEVSFGNQCQFKCGYCHPRISSSFWKEIEEFGPYNKVQNSNLDIKKIRLWNNEEKNPYLEAWWKWWPELKKTLNILRITGGEPLLHTSTWKILENISITPLPSIELHINSNFGINSVLLRKLSGYVNDFQKNKKIKSFRMSTSIDTWGEQAEYIRTGLDLNIWEENLHNFLTTTRGGIYIMITFNILTVTNFKSLLQKILEWRKIYNDPKNSYNTRVRFDVIYLRTPKQYDMNLLPKKEFMPYMYESLEYIKENINKKDPTTFTMPEYLNFKRIVDYMGNTIYSKEKLIEYRSDFYYWFQEYDKRRGTNFGETFPEYSVFMEKCRKLAEVQKYINYNKKREKIRIYLQEQYQQTLGTKIK